MPAPAISRTLAAEGAPRGGLAALCITQTTGWGVLSYALIAAVRPISDDTGWLGTYTNMTYAMAAATGTAALIAVAGRLSRGPHAR